MVVDLNSVDKPMIFAQKLECPMMMSERTSGRAMLIHAWLAEKQVTKERHGISERVGVVKSKIFQGIPKC